MLKHIISTLDLMHLHYNTMYFQCLSYSLPVGLDIQYRIRNEYMVSISSTDIHEAWERPGFGEQPHEVAGLLDDTHTVVIDHLPRGVSPSRMKNKLTIYFQRKHNGGGEVVDVTYPTAHPDQAYVTFRNRRGTLGDMWDKVA